MPENPQYLQENVVESQRQKKAEEIDPVSYGQQSP